jgi:hypothetical protein
MKPRSVPVLVVLSLCLLAGCSASPATTTSSSTATAAPTTLPLATPVPSLTPTTDRDPFQVNLLQQYQVITCPAEPNPPNLCYTLQDDPSASTLGMISFAGTDILYVLPEATRCGVAERHGAMKLADGTPLPFTRRGCIVFPAIRCSLPLP